MDGFGRAGGGGGGSLSLSLQVCGVISVALMGMLGHVGGMLGLVQHLRMVLVLDLTRWKVSP